MYNFDANHVAKRFILADPNYFSDFYWGFKADFHSVGREKQRQ